MVRRCGGGREYVEGGPQFFSFCGGQPANGGQQFIIDRGNGNNGANGRPCNGLPDKFGLAHVIVFQPLGKVGVFFLGHAGFDHMAAVGRVVFFFFKR